MTDGWQPTHKSLSRPLPRKFFRSISSGGEEVALWRPYATCLLPRLERLFRAKLMQCDPTKPRMAMLEKTGRCFLRSNLCRGYMKLTPLSIPGRLRKEERRRQMGRERADIDALSSDGATRAPGGRGGICFDSSLATSPNEACVSCHMIQSLHPERQDTEPGRSQRSAPRLLRILYIACHATLEATKQTTLPLELARLYFFAPLCLSRSYRSVAPCIHHWYRSRVRRLGKVSHFGIFRGFSTLGLSGQPPEVRDRFVSSHATWNFLELSALRSSHKQ